MTVKQFLQSKIFKCILVLMCIALISGGLLAILNDVLDVSKEELIQRGIKAACGESASYEEIKFPENKKQIDFENGYVSQVLLLKDGKYANCYLIKATGKHGFQEGSVTVYALFKKDGEEYAVEKIAIADYASSQTLMSKITDAGLNRLAKNPSIAPGEIASGATYSSTAIKNAVNSAVEYMKTINGEG